MKESLDPPEPERQTLVEFDPYNPATLPAAAWAYVGSNISSAEERVAAFRAWREESERELRMQVLAAQLEVAKNECVESAKDSNEVLTSAESQPRVGNAAKAARVLDINVPALNKRRREGHLPPGSVITSGRRHQYRLDLLPVPPAKKSRKKAAR